MLAFPDPTTPPAAELLSDAFADDTADQVDSCILAALGQPTESALERCYRQAVVCLDMSREEVGGPSLVLDVPRDTCRFADTTP